jgi:hypothetical protein
MSDHFNWFFNDFVLTSLKFPKKKIVNVFQIKYFKIDKCVTFKVVNNKLKYFQQVELKVWRNKLVGVGRG